MVKSGGGARFERIKCQCSRKVVEALHVGSHDAIGEDDRQVEAEALALPFVEVRSCCNVARGRQSHLDRQVSRLTRSSDSTMGGPDHSGATFSKTRIREIYYERPILTGLSAHKILGFDHGRSRSLRWYVFHKFSKERPDPSRCCRYSRFHLRTAPAQVVRGPCVQRNQQHQSVEAP